MASVDLQEKANFTRLSRLLVDKGTEALRNTFDAIHPPASLPAVLIANRASLLKLKPRVINNSQWDLLFPPSGNPPDSKTFDVTLLTVLFRNICGLPSTGWGAMPLDTDRSMQANILRIKLFRNEVYAHVTSTQVDNATFESLWQKISQALVELNIPQNNVDDLKTCSLGPEEEIYVEILEEWKSQEEESMKVLTSIVEESRDGIRQIHQSILEQTSDRSKERDASLLRKLAKHNFKGKISRKVKLFHPGTRKWLSKKVDEFIKSEDESRMLLLTAGPGFGKSVFAAKVCEDFKKKEKLAACHFCDFSNSNLRDPMMMLQSLASQMCENIASFKEKLLDQLKRPHEVRSLKDAFLIYLQNPLDELELEEPRLVVIDGLDESAADNKNEIVNLIADYFPDLPDCIKVLVTSRPEISVAKLSGVQKINIENNNNKNDLDLLIYLKACLPSLAEKVKEIPWRSVKSAPPVISSGFRFSPERRVCDALAEKCEGSFLYAFYVQSELQKRSDLGKMTYDEIMKFLPKDLDSIYMAYFNRFEDELKAIMHGNLDVLKILEMLATSKEPLPLSFVSRTLDLAPDCRETRMIINKVNETVSCLLYVSDDLVTVFHKSVIDWLLANGYKEHEYTVKVSDGNKSLWLRCEQVFEEIKENVCSGQDVNLTNDVTYALDHGFRYLEACNMEESYFWLVDVVIIHVLFAIYPKMYDDSDNIKFLSNLWVEILQGSVVISDKLRERILWHVFETDFLIREFKPKMESHYLHNVLAHSRKGYFSDNEKKIAESLLLKIPRFVENNYNHDELEVMPLAFWRGRTKSPKIKAVVVSYDKTMAAVAQWHGTISVISLPCLVELWQYSTYKNISCCTFAPDDSLLLFGNLKTALNITERKELPFFHGNKETFTSCGFSPNGNRLVTSDGSSTIKLWDVAKQSLLSLLCADNHVNGCSFSSTGLFIIANWKCDLLYFEDSESDSESSEGERPLAENPSRRRLFGRSSRSRLFGNWRHRARRLDFSDSKDSIIEEKKADTEDSFCIWNAITWQRCDARNLRDVNEPGIFQNKKCNTCFRPEFEESNSLKRLEIKPFMPLKVSEKRWSTSSTGIYNGVKCIFVLKGHSLSVIETAHFTTIAAWNIFVDIFHKIYDFRKVTAIEDDLWFYADAGKLVVFRTLAPTQETTSCLPRPTHAISTSFSPDGSRLATCTSDRYINIWNVDTSKVEQRFKSNHGDSLFACWWSKDFLFVFDCYDRTLRLSKYPVGVNLKILFSQGQQVPLSNLVEEFVSLSAIVDFSEGFLIFKCGNAMPVKVLDVKGVRGPRIITLPGIKSGMRITVSPGAFFVAGGGDDECFIWGRNTEDAAVFNQVFFSELLTLYNFTCCFSNDSKIAVLGWITHTTNSDQQLRGKIVNLDSGDYKSISFETNDMSKFFCLKKDRVVINTSHHAIQIFDMDSGALLETSIQRYLTEDLVKQTKLSPKKTVLAFPMINGDMEFLRLSIPPEPSLSSMKREAATKWLKCTNHDDEDSSDDV